MQISWQFLWLTVLFAVVHCSFDLKNLRSVSTGTSFGMCRGYCQQSINITINPLQITTKKEPNFPQSSFPSVQKTYPFTSGQWQGLSDVLNLKAFDVLGDTIGCPDCADGGAEWIEIDSTDGVKRVTFENGQDVKGIEAMIEKLRQLRNQYLV